MKRHNGSPIAINLIKYCSKIGRVIICMDYTKLPTNVLHVREAIEELRRRDFVEARQFFQLSQDIVDYDRSLFALHHSHSLMLYACTKALALYRTHVQLEDRVGILFMAAENNTVHADGRIAHFKKYNVIMSFNMNAVDIIRPINVRVKNVAIILEREALVEEYGLRYDLMPQYVQMAMRKSSSLPARLMFALSPRCRIILDDIFDRHFDGITSHRYLRAKTEELLCELVQYMNNTGARKVFAANLPKEEIFRQSIEMAAQI